MSDEVNRVSQDGRVAKKTVSKKRSATVPRATPEQRKIEDTVKKMFVAQGKDYNAWLMKQHQTYIMQSVMKNEEDILDALEGE